MIKKIERHRKYIVIFIILLLLLGIGYSLKAFLYPSNSKSVYGDRLDGIDAVEISKDRQNTMVEEIKKNTGVNSASIDIKGAIINFIIDGKEELTVDKAEALADSTLTPFSDKEVKFYDFQFFITNSKLKYTLLGYKNKATEKTVWTEVDNNEK